MDPLSIPFGGAVMDSRAVPSSEKLCCTLMLISLAALTRKLLAAPGRAGLPSSTFPPSVRPSVRPQQQQRGRGLPDPSRRAPCSVLSEEESIRFKEVCFALSLPSPFSSPFWLRCLVFQASPGGSASPPLGGESWGRGFGVWFLNHALTLGSGSEELGVGVLIFVLGGAQWEHLPPFSLCPTAPAQGRAQLSAHNPKLPQSREPTQGPSPIHTTPSPVSDCGVLPPKSKLCCADVGRPSCRRGGSRLCPTAAPGEDLPSASAPHAAPPPPPISGWERKRCGEGEQKVGAHGSPPPPLLWVQDPILAHRRRSAVAARPVPPVRDA